MLFYGTKGLFWTFIRRDHPVRPDIPARAPMPLYFIHTVYPDKIEKDLMGIDCENDEAACREAQLGARDVIADEVRTGKEVRLKRSFRVERDDGTLVCEIPFNHSIVLDDEA